MRLNDAWLAEAPPRNRKASLTETKSISVRRDALRLHPTSASSSTIPGHSSTVKPLKWAQVDASALWFSGAFFFVCLVPEVEPKSSQITDEFREVVGVWKWEVRREGREAKWCRGEHFSSNLRPCLRTLIHTEIQCQRSSSERYSLSLWTLLELSSSSGHLNHPLNARFRWKKDAVKAHSDRISTVCSCSWMMPACWTGIYCLLTLVHICSGRMRIEVKWFIIRAWKV